MTENFDDCRFSGNLITIDLDSHDAVRLAPEFLPSTKMVDGRQKKQQPHGTYRVAKKQGHWEG